MFKRLLLIAPLLISIPGQAQDDFASWDEKYLPKDYKKLIAEEKAYEGQVRKEEKLPHNYSRYDTYRLRGKFLGRSRPIEPKVMQSINAD